MRRSFPEAFGAKPFSTETISPGFSGEKGKVGGPAGSPVRGGTGGLWFPGFLLFFPEINRLNP
ncbi:MAG: hypothetical protein PHR34_06060, partial [Kiritimatiellae bacterium]|nr:hypothetical protein [Kiritimatiellia bacterium]